MEQTPRLNWYARTIGWIVVAYGLAVIVNTLNRQFHVHRHHNINELFLTVPVFIGISYVYLGTLLLRLKYTAWLTMLALSAFTLVFDVYALSRIHFHIANDYGLDLLLRTIITAAIAGVLLASRPVFRVRSDMVGFRRAARVSIAVLLVTFLYGVIGFSLFDEHDFHTELNLISAAHQTIDQFGLTEPGLVAHTARARVFVDSLSVISWSAVLYVAVAFFQPIRFWTRSGRREREQAEGLLNQYPSDIDDFFKLWPHDKHYFFDKSGEAGLAYRVANGVALVVSDPFGNPKRFLMLCRSFQEFCFVNDWRPAFIHVGRKHRSLYEKLGMRLQKIGEEAVLNLDEFQGHSNGKYFRQIRNRFTKLGYHVELLTPPHDEQLLADLARISKQWLERPGRAERGFMMGYYSEDYMQLSTLAVLYDEQRRVHGFMNIVPAYESGVANFDMLRCDADTPGNGNDFLLMNAIELLHGQGTHTLNLGLCPLKGLDEKAESTSVIDVSLRFIYANGDRFYSFSGLQRFKDKYHPVWEDRYIAFSGNPASFARIMRALTSAMKVK